MNGDERLNLHLKRSALVLAWMLIAVGAIWFTARLWVVISRLLNVLSPFLIALVIAYIFNPIVNTVQRRLKLGRIGGILVVALIILGILAAFFGFLVPILYDQVADTVAAIKANLPALLEKFSHKIGYATTQNMLDGIAQRVRAIDWDLRPALNKAAETMPSLTAGGVSAVGKVVRGLGALFGGVVGFLVATALVMVITFYSLVQFDAIPRLIRQMLPARHEGRVMDILGKVDEAAGGFLRGQIIAASIVGVLAAAGLAAIGMYRYAVLIGVIAGVGNLIPYLGPVLGATPALLWSFFSPAHATWGQRLTSAALVVALFAVIHLIDGLFSQPRIVGKKSHLHPLAVIAALVIGARFGITGMILAVPTAAIVRVLLRELWWNEHVARRQAAAHGSTGSSKRP